MTPEKFYEDVVKPNLVEFGRNEDDARCAFNLIASVDALAAQIFYWCRANNPAHVAGVKHDTEYRQKLAEANPDFELFRDIAKAQKHTELVQGDPTVTHAGQVKPGQLGWDEVAWDHAKWDGAQEIIVETNQKGRRSIWLICTRAATLLGQEMVTAGIIKT